MKVSRKIVLLIIFAALIFVAGVWLNRIWTDYRGTAYDRGHRRAWTHSRLQFIANVVQLELLDTDENPPKEMDSLLRWLNTYSYDFKTFSDESWFDPNTGALIDYWGTPVSLVVKTPEEYTFISAGPNRRSENGQGDDIVYTFDPFELRKKRK